MTLVAHASRRARPRRALLSMRRCVLLQPDNLTLRRPPSEGGRLEGWAPSTAAEGRTIAAHASRRARPRRALLSMRRCLLLQPDHLTLRRPPPKGGRLEGWATGANVRQGP